jgi:hypothetical protein
MATQTQQRRLKVPKHARIKTYYDTKLIDQNKDVINFFTPNASKEVTRDNYIQNPFPGDATRRIAGLSFELVPQFISNDSDNSIDAAAIVNAMKFSGVIITADQSYRQFLRAPMAEYSNFADTQYIGGTAILKKADMYRLSDPFDIASNQNLNLAVHFNDATGFPKESDWEASGQKKPYLRATLYLAEISQ